MLMERKTELDGPISEPKSYRWIWLLGAAAPIALLSYLLDPWAGSGDRPDVFSAYCAAKMAGLRGLIFVGVAVVQSLLGWQLYCHPLSGAAVQLPHQR